MVRLPRPIAGRSLRHQASSSSECRNTQAAVQLAAVKIVWVWQCNGGSAVGGVHLLAFCAAARAVSPKPVSGRWTAHFQVLHSATHVQPSRLSTHLRAACRDLQIGARHTVSPRVPELICSTPRERVFLLRSTSALRRSDSICQIVVAAVRLTLPELQLNLRSIENAEAGSAVAAGGIPPKPLRCARGGLYRGE